MPRSRQTPQRKSFGYRMGMDHLLVAHDPTLTTLARPEGFRPICSPNGMCSPNGIRTRVATLRDRPGMSSMCAHVQSSLVIGLHASRSSARVRPIPWNGWADGWAVGSRNPLRPRGGALVNPPSSPCSGVVPSCRRENPARHRPGDVSPASEPAREHSYRHSRAPRLAIFRA